MSHHTKSRFMLEGEIDCKLIDKNSSYSDKL